MKKNESIQLLLSMLHYHFDICKANPIQEVKNSIDFSLTPSTSDLRFIENIPSLNTNGKICFF